MSYEGREGKEMKGKLVGKGGKGRMLLLLFRCGGKVKVEKEGKNCRRG